MMNMMRLVAELNDEEYVDLIVGLADDVNEAKGFCERMHVNFEDVKCYDWGFDWQYEQSKKLYSKILKSEPQGSVHNRKIIPHWEAVCQ